MKKLLASLAVVIAIMGASAAVSPISYAAIDPSESVTDGIEGAGGDTSNGGDQLPELIRSIINILLYIIGAVAVIMIVLGGIRYTISNGDSGQISSAKNTILYAVVGLVVALLAYAIVNFVVDAF